MLTGSRRRTASTIPDLSDLDVVQLRLEPLDGKVECMEYRNLRSCLIRITKRDTAASPTGILFT